MRRLLRALGALILLGILVVAGAVAAVFYYPLPMPADKVDFVIDQGSTMRGVARQVNEAGVRVPPEALLAVARISGMDRQVKAGGYEMTRGETLWTLLNRMSRGDVTQREVAFIEGWTFRQMRAALARHPDVTQTLGTLDDAALLEAEALAADAVVNAADSDHEGAVRALLAGLAGSGKPFIHTSGTSLVGDEAMGEPSDAIFTEDTSVTPEPDKEHRVALNQRIIDAAPGVRTIVLCNSLIYGDTLGPPAQSVQIPPLVAQARESGVARYIGRGRNIWSNVHIADMADLYALALEKAPAGSFYYVENGEAAFGDLVQAIADALDLGQAQGWSAQEAVAKWGRELAVFALGSNSRVRADKARKDLGWAPTRSSAIDWVRESIRA